MTNYRLECMVSILRIKKNIPLERFVWDLGIIIYIYHSKSGCLSLSSARLICRKDNHKKIPCPKAKTASLTVTNPTIWYHALITRIIGCVPSRYKSHGTETLGTQATAESVKATAWNLSPVILWVCKGMWACLTIPITSGIVVRNGKRMKKWRPWKRAMGSRSIWGQFGWCGGQKISDTASAMTGPMDTMRKPK